MKAKFIFVSLLLLMGIVTGSFLSCERPSGEAVFSSELNSQKIANLDSLPDGLGVAGAFAGVHNNVLMIGGGANFLNPIWETNKKYHSDISVLQKVVGKNNAEEYIWIDTNAAFPEERAYGASVTTNEGVICIGGHNSNGALSTVTLLSWNKTTNSVDQIELPALPFGITTATAVVTSSNWKDGVIYLLGGNSADDITKAGDYFYSLKLSDINLKAENPSTTAVWKNEGPLPNGARSAAISAWQHDGKEYCLFLISGRRAAPTEDSPLFDSTKVYPYAMEFLTDAYKWVPSKKEWQELSNTPVPMAAGTGWPWGLNHILVLSMDDGDYMNQRHAGTLVANDDHPNFKNIGYAYHAVTDTWTKIENLPANHVQVPPARWGDSATSPIVIVPGEIKPRIRATEIYLVSVAAQMASFGFINYFIIVLYLFGMLGVGVFFYLKDRKVANTDTFFKGGGKIPFWVAAFSLFATMLSSITFVAVPGKAYATDWTNFVLTITMFAVTPFVIKFFLPFFRGIKSASAYEYLENRFNLVSRIFAATIFMIYHILRMGIVMYLPALALSSILKMSPDPQTNMVLSILIMGLLSVIYCSLGGLSAVVWTDTIQSFVLLSAAFLTVFIIIAKVGGFGDFFAVATEAGKFNLAVPDFSAGSFRNPVLWVVLLGGIGQNLIPYASDQSIIQRYMAVKDIKETKKSIWTNAFLSIGANALFFFVGTSLFVFYKYFPADLDPSMAKVDQVFPRFIIQELPIGIAGLVVAAILAAAQSTVSTSINSATAVMVSDYLQRFSKKSNPKLELAISRYGSAAFGICGTVCGLVLVGLNNPSIWDSFLSMLGLVLGALCGLFLLGIFSKRANGIGAIFGVLLGIFTTLLAQRIGIHPYLYGVVNLVATPMWGYLFSLAFTVLKVPTFATSEQMQLSGLKGFYFRWFCAGEGKGALYSWFGRKNKE